jgi:hypothetical protein
MAWGRGKPIASRGPAGRRRRHGQHRSHGVTSPFAPTGLADGFGGKGGPRPAKRRIHPWSWVPRAPHSPSTGGAKLRRGCAVADLPPRGRPVDTPILGAARQPRQRATGRLIGGCGRCRARTSRDGADLHDPSPSRKDGVVFIKFPDRGIRAIHGSAVRRGRASHPAPPALRRFGPCGRYPAAAPATRCSSELS